MFFTWLLYSFHVAGQCNGRRDVAIPCPQRRLLHRWSCTTSIYNNGRSGRSFNPHADCSQRPSFVRPSSSYDSLNPSWLSAFPPILAFTVSPTPADSILGLIYHSFNSFVSFIPTLLFYLCRLVSYVFPSHIILMSLHHTNFRHNRLQCLPLLFRWLEPKLLLRSV